MPTINIDNHILAVEPGATILQAAKLAGIRIPTLCHLEGQRPLTSCMVCVVKVNSGARLLPACATVVTEGMVVESETAEVRAARRTALELLLSDHRGDCQGPCRLVCPAHMDIPTMIRQIASGELREAIMTIKTHIPLPAALGRVCPELCERGCRRGEHDAPISICKLKRYAADVDLADDTPYLPPCEPSSGKHVAIIGAGPAGLTAAWYLCQQGHVCDLFDDHDAPGGMLRYGVAPDILPTAVLDAEINLIRALGVEFHLNTRIDNPPALLGEYDAVLLAVGHLEHATSPPQPSSPSEKEGATEKWVDRQSLSPPLKERLIRGGGSPAIPGLFFCGAHPVRHAVRAVAEGRNAALAINAFLTGLPILTPERLFSTHLGHLNYAGMALLVRHVADTPRVEAADGFAAAQAVAEAERCLHCDCRKLETCKLRQWSVALDARVNAFKGESREFAQEMTISGLLYESGKCISCGLCVQIAEGAREEFGLSFIGRGFSVRVAVPFNETLEQALREVAVQCVDACPTGALAWKETE